MVPGSTKVWMTDVWLTMVVFMSESVQIVVIRPETPSGSNEELRKL